MQWYRVGVMMRSKRARGVGGGGGAIPDADAAERRHPPRWQRCGRLPDPSPGRNARGKSHAAVLQGVVTAPQHHRWRVLSGFGQPGWEAVALRDLPPELSLLRQ